MASQRVRDRPPQLRELKLGALPKLNVLEVTQCNRRGGPAESHREYYEEGWSPSSLPSVPMCPESESLGVPMVGALLGPHHGDSKTKWEPVGWPVGSGAWHVSRGLR